MFRQFITVGGCKTVNVHFKDGIFYTKSQKNSAHFNIIWRHQELNILEFRLKTGKRNTAKNQENFTIFLFF